MVDSTGNGKGRAESSIFGSGAKLKQEALGVILDEMKDAPEVLMRGGGVGADVVGELLLKQ